MLAKQRSANMAAPAPFLPDMRVPDIDEPPFYLSSRPIT
jgi:hypothetical protein